MKFVLPTEDKFVIFMAQKPSTSRNFIKFNYVLDWLLVRSEEKLMITIHLSWWRLRLLVIPFELIGLYRKKRKKINF